MHATRLNEVIRGLCSSPPPAGLRHPPPRSAPASTAAPPACRVPRSGTPDPPTARRTTSVPLARTGIPKFYRWLSERYPLVWLHERRRSCCCCC
eukprot:363665-Chlamydomonas_euryale.AAC.4